jgi:predicted transcriptional regulator of viral defense system
MQAARFGGIVTTKELGRAGVSAAQIRRMVRQGVLMPVGHGTYARATVASRVASDPVGEHALRLASVLAVANPCDVGSHHSAALIHGLDLLGKCPPDVAVTRPPGGSQKSRSGVHLRVSALPSEHVTVSGGIRLTSVARTVVDLARASSFRSGVVVADSALRSKQTSKAELQSVVDDCARWRGIAQARLVVEFSDGRSESALESISRVAFHDQGLPAPELQVWVGGDDEGVIGRVDFLWRQYRTIGEADGALKYKDTARAISQLRRDELLRAAGFEVVHFTWYQILQTPGQVAASLREAFRRGVGR